MNRCGETQPFYTALLETLHPAFQAARKKRNHIPGNPDIQENLDNTITVGLHGNAPDVEAALYNLFGFNF
jgi:hypothetical protein